MIVDLKAYPEYKESGLPWLGKVPAHWEVLPLRGLLAERKEKNDPIKTTNILSLSLQAGVIPYADKKPGGNKAKDDLSAYMLAYPGDIVLNSMNVVVGSVGLSKYFGAVSPVYYMLRPRHPDDSVEFFAAIFQASVFHRSLFGLGNGILVIQSKTSGKLNTIRMRIPMTKLRRVQLPYPAPKEQVAIVRFLNWANGRLERAIRAKRKVIALLNEQKQAIIHRAVTGGLDPSVPLKSSGVPWLGHIPQHWDVLRSKYIYREVDNRSAAGQETHLSMSQKFGLIPSSQIEEKRLVSESYAGAKLCEKGDLVLNRLKAHLGVFALAPEHGLVSPDYTVLRPVRELDERYFEAVYRSPACRVELRKRAKGIVQGFWRLYTDDFYDIRVPVPPVTEQKSIIAKLDLDLSGINTPITRLEHEIELLREYRTRLVADVVTGQLDVREAAACLPNEVTPKTAEDGTDLGNEAEPTDEEVAV
jgi:type I restriction enzyme, S subunit